jgi:hypothetical protein
MEISLREAEQELQDARCAAGEIGSIEESKLIEETGISADREETDRIKAKPVVIKTVTKTIKCRKLKKKDQFCRPITIKNAKGDVSFSAQKNNTKQLSISKSTGRIRIKHNTGKGKYKLKVKIRVKGKEGDADYVKNVTVHIIVK